MACITLTFSTRGENHHGNQVVGTMKPGFKPENFNPDFMEVCDLSQGVRTTVRDALLGGITDFCSDIKEELNAELLGLEWDSKCLMRGTVKNKHARHNLVFAWHSQSPEYEQGKGTIVDISRLLVLPVLVDRVVRFMNRIGYRVDPSELIVEGNLYYDQSCYIGFHGDAERQLVMGVRLGDRSMPLHFGWWQNRKFVPGSMKSITLEAGDAYLMSEKAVGTDWKSYKNGLMTLRHAAGDPAVLQSKGQWPPAKENDQEEE